MKTVVLCKEEFEALPPAMSLALVAKRVGYDVEVVTSSSNRQTKARFAEEGIGIVDVCPKLDARRSGPLAKARFWRAFARGAWRHIDQTGRDTLLWVSTADTALALGTRLTRRRYVLGMLELYDNHPFYRRALANYVRRAACVVVPEMCRAAVVRSWYQLRQTPTILPNKPADHPRGRNLEIEDAHAGNLLASRGQNGKLVLYQGGIRSYSELRYVADAVGSMGDGWRFVIMGSGNQKYLQALKKSAPNIVHIPRVIAPYHLQVTSHAYIGIVTYSYECLNFVFCAPNKTWEYAGFGLPMLCNDLPPLRLAVQGNGAGLCADIENSRQIASALREIDGNYDSFSQAAHRLYDSVDTHDIVRSVLKQARLRA